MSDAVTTSTTDNRREFTVEGALVSDRRSPVRWIISHVRRNRLYLSAFIGFTLLASVMTSFTSVLTGQAFDEVLDGDGDRLGIIALSILAVVLVRGVVDLTGRLAVEILGKRLARDARDELYVSLLGKSQTFHNRQRVGDIMARASNDIQQLSMMMTPGVDLILDSTLTIIVPVIFIATINLQLLLAPAIFIVGFAVTLRAYVRRLRPVSGAMRANFGAMNAGLAETVTGIEVVKSTAQEAQEERKFANWATRYRDSFVRQGEVQSLYLPPLVLGLAMTVAFLHGILLVDNGTITIGNLVTFMGLMGMLFFASHISVFTFALVQLGIAGAQRILAIMNETTELDENDGGYRERIRGEIVFENVSFSYGDAPVLRDVSFRVEPGQTVAIVGQTGSGKSTLTKLVNRIYDIDSGRITIDGIDTRDWQLDALRSQVSTIEQDVFLFSKTIAENIGFSLGGRATPEEIERAARDAQAHDFIMSFKDGYETIIGERGVTLSGGQRQRLAIARALLTDPHILILDDSTSAIDSATEDEIQQAIRRLQEGRTTLLITHRLSQIRWADSILVVHQGRVIDQGTHDELLTRCDLYRRIFAHYDVAVTADA
ncbi:MAG TPA: ABC transporter ATP-binding protein [Thermomicrobiales bacterium]|nr:ABC transporter ATP-binding protein [Thermomicrobiales bacterium]